MASALTPARHAERGTEAQPVGEQPEQVGVRAGLVLAGEATGDDSALGGHHYDRDGDGRDLYNPRTQGNRLVFGCPRPSCPSGRMAPVLSLRPDMEFAGRKRCGS